MNNRTASVDISRADDEAAVLRLLDEQASAWQAGDGAAFAATCTEDAVFVSVIGEHIVGRTALAAVMQQGFDGFMKDTRWSSPKQTTIRFPVADTAIVVTDGLCVLRPGSDTCRPEDLSIQTRTAVRVAGRWLFASFQNTRIVSPGDFPQVEQ